VGGVSQVQQIASDAGKFNAPSAFSLTDDLSIVSALLLGMVSMLSSTGSDQVVLQTYLTAKSGNEAKKSLKLSGYFIKPLSLIFPLLGVIIFVYFKAFPQTATSIRVPDDSLPVFITNVMPAGLRGLAVASILSALFTSLNAGMTALSAVVQVDYIQRIRQKPLSDKASVVMGRSLIILWGVIIICCAFLIMQLGTSNNIIQILNIVMYPFSGVLLGIFLLGLLTKRANARGALIGATVGFLITLFVPLSKFILVNILNIDADNSSSIVTAIINLSKTSNFYYGALGVLMTIIIGYFTSFLSKPIPAIKLAGLVKSLENHPVVHAAFVEAKNK
jgi:Na+/proline symporter